ncbi:MAG: 4Fe-4S dicluster domain-containing protein [Acidobacteriota bacterium]
MTEIAMTMKYQREADPGWSAHIRELPGCERVSSCIQCGTCSGTCPMSIYMDYTPRRIISLIREGFKEDALGSKTIWLCASCYSCTVECPQQVHITDVMYTLKREAIREKKFPARFPIPVLAREFYAIVKRRGRSSEIPLVLRMALKSNPFILLTMMKSGWDLFRTGRISLKYERIKQADKLEKALSATKEVA